MPRANVSTPHRRKCAVIVNHGKILAVPGGGGHFRDVTFDQGEFDFEANLPGDGYRRWREQLEMRQRAFERQWGVTLGRRVSVMLRDHAKPVTGVIRMVGDEPPPGQPPELEIRGLRFFPGEIESIVDADDASS